MRDIARWIFDILPSITALGFAGLGLSLILLPKELKMLEQPRLKWLRWGLAASFLVIGITAFTSDVIQKSADKTDRQKLQGDIARLKDQIEEVEKDQKQNTNASVGLSTFGPYHQAQVISSDEPINFNIGYEISRNVALNARSYNEFYIADSSPDGKHDKEVVAKFRSLAAGKIIDRGADVAPGTINWATITVKPTKVQSAGIMAGTKTLYALGTIHWRNASGSDGHLEVCLWLQQPESKVLTLESPWHSCLP